MIYLHCRFTDIHVGNLRDLLSESVDDNDVSLSCLISVGKLTRKKKFVGNKPNWSPSFNSCSISLVNEVVLPFWGR